MTLVLYNPELDEGIILFSSKLGDVIVSKCDAPLLRQYNWRVTETPSGNIGYCCSTVYFNKKWATFLMHRLIMGFPTHQIDHINGNHLDNRRSNLRKATQQENLRGKHITKKPHGYKGIYKAKDKWRAQIYIKNKRKHLGMFDTKELAAAAYNSAAVEMYGEFAVLNKIGEL